jgi:hypothetical protein
MQFFRRPAKMQFLCYGREITQVAKIHRFARNIKMTSIIY